MGLDMYARSTTLEIKEWVDFDVPEREDELEVHYWRKHPNLHGWMEELYRARGGKDQDFNCVNVRLTYGDLASLETDIRSGGLPDTQGFFFGQSRGTEEEKQDDLAFIEKAKSALLAGRTVFYRAWW